MKLIIYQTGRRWSEKEASRAERGFAALMNYAGARRDFLSCLWWTRRVDDRVLGSEIQKCYVTACSRILFATTTPSTRTRARPRAPSDSVPLKRSHFVNLTPVADHGASSASATLSVVQNVRTDWKSRDKKDPLTSNHAVRGLCVLRPVCCGIDSCSTARDDRKRALSAWQIDGLQGCSAHVLVERKVSETLPRLETSGAVVQSFRWVIVTPNCYQISS